MDKNVEPPPAVADRRENGLHLAFGFDIQWHQQLCPHSLGDWPHIGLGLLVHIGQRDLGPRVGKGPSASGSDGMSVRDPYHQCDFAHQRFYRCIT